MDSGNNNQQMNVGYNGYGQNSQQMNVGYNGYGQVNQQMNVGYNGYGQGNQQMNASYNGYGQNSQQMNVGYNGYGQGNQQINAGYNGCGQSKYGVTNIFGLVSALLLFLGIITPFMDFSTFHEKVHIQYNLIKICKNVGLISAPWMGIPYGIIIGIILMVILSFVKIPILRIIPVILILAMLIIMLADISNVVLWVQNIIDKYLGEGIIVIDKTSIMKSFMIGLYLLISGIVVGLVGCFIKQKEA